MYPVGCPGNAEAPPADPTVDCVAVKTSITPVPEVPICKSAFEAFDFIVLSVIVTPSTFNVPVIVCVPFVVMSAVVSVPSIVAAPSTFNASFMLIIDESSELIDVPFKLKPPNLIEPVPDGFITKSEFEAFALIVLSVIVTPSSVDEPGTVMLPPKIALAPSPVNIVVVPD